MSEILGAFHFVRPWWFFGLLLPVAMYWFVLRLRTDTSAWAKACDAHLLRHLVQQSDGNRRRWPLHLAALATSLCVLALAGPTWQKRPQPVLKSLDARVIVLDLSRSMMSPDLKPHRLQRARFKVADMLARQQEGQTGLVVFAGDAFVVSPLTQDGKTIAAMLNALVPEVVPTQGSNASTGLRMAADLLRQSGELSGDILLVADGVDEAAADVAQRALDDGFAVSVMAVGTQEGAPVSLPQGGFLKDASGNIVVPRVNLAALREVAAFGGGRFVEMRSDTKDIDRLLARDLPRVNANAEEVDRTGDTWREEGPWIVLALLPMAALAFRRGWLLGIAVLFVLPVEPVRALDWADLWQRPDQQAERQMEANNHADAALLAEDPWLRGTALFRSEQFEAAAASFAQLSTPDGHYNRGNALARLGKLQEAIAAYDEALAQSPGMDDALENKRLLEELLEQQQQEQQQSNEDQNDSEDSGNQEQSEEQQGESSEDQESEQDQGEAAEQEAQQNQQKELAEADETLSEEERQAVEQWLRRIPDDPGGLLRRKFLRQYQRRETKPTSEQAW